MVYSLASQPRAFTLIEMLIVISIISTFTFVAMTGIARNVSQSNLIHTGSFMENVIQNEKVQTIAQESRHTKLTFTKGDKFYTIDTQKFELPYRLALIKDGGIDKLTMVTDSSDKRVYTLIKTDEAGQVQLVSSIGYDERLAQQEKIALQDPNLKIDKNHQNRFYVLPPSTSAEENTIYNTLAIQYYDMTFTDQETFLSQINWNGNSTYTSAMLDLSRNLKTSYTVFQGNTFTNANSFSLTLENKDHHTTVLRL